MRRVCFFHHLSLHFTIQNSYIINNKARFLPFDKRLRTNRCAINYKKTIDN